MTPTGLVMVLVLALVFEGGQCQHHEVFVAEGSVAVLPCVDGSSSVSHPNAVYWSKVVGNSQKTVWRREKSGLEFRPLRDLSRAKCPVPNFGKADYSLHIAETKLADGGKYFCEVEGKTKMLKVIMLRVIKASISPSIVVEGLRMEAMCHVSPETPHISIKWKQNGKFINSPIISSVSQRDAGKWTCQVSYNNMRMEATTTLQVRGISSPQNDSLVFYGSVGSSISLPCVFTDGLIPNTVNWMRVSAATNSPVLLPHSAFNSSFGLIKRVELGDEGTYTCSGLMGLNGGKIKLQRTMRLVVARVLSSSSDPMILMCNLSDSRQITSYEWLRVNYGPNNTQRVTTVQRTKNPSIRVTEKDAGEWMCRYYGNQGLLGNVTSHFYTMGALKSENSSSGNKTAMVMGLGFLFMVIFLILFQMYRNYRRKQKIHLYPAMENIVHQTITEREWKERSREKRAEACVGEPKSVCV
ncbi:uncharacterized protein LOC130243610 [Danio aesculapii]|uniref:uncharacterized protein LOC130243610 n=1 Tax=Danio aesculapii TaxID=1142201 RepID=UPI0024C082BC|nr:uncharacterized protein LOC130243610 [Danio aesculapii]